MDNPARLRCTILSESISSLLPPPTADEQVVLCAEDGDGDFALIQMALEEVFPAVRTYRALNGEQAIQFLDQYGKSQNSRCPALILLDNRMPGKKSGFDVLEYIKTQVGLCPIPSVMLTSSRDVRDKQRALALGAAEFITKPSTLNPFIEEVRNLCSRHLRRSPTTA